MMSAIMLKIYDVLPHKHSLPLHLPIFILLANIPKAFQFSSENFVLLR